ncbi:hypothetical protein BJP39_19440 [Streptomyces sp. CC77]|nr:hypothetical protein BJP39_19440 [Streptomyces sp. CC77]
MGGRRRTWGTGAWVGASLGVVTAVAVVVAIGSIWESCDIGVSSSANSAVLLVPSPFVWVLSAALWALPLAGWGRVSRGVAVVLGAVANLLFVWFLVSWLGVLDSYPDPRCPGNVPAWWPGFLPV